MPRDRNKKGVAKKSGRGLIKMLIDPAVFSQLTPGRKFRISSSPIPNGTIIVGAGYDHGRHSFVLILQHDGFEKVPPGELIPVKGSLNFEFLEEDPSNGDPQHKGENA